MRNYKALKAAGKSSVKKQEGVSAEYNDDGSEKIKEVREELQLVTKSYDPQTGVAQDDSVRAYSLSEVKSEIDHCKSQVTRLEARQADLEELEKDLKAL